MQTHVLAGPAIRGRLHELQEGNAGQDHRLNRRPAIVCTVHATQCVSLGLQGGQDLVAEEAVRIGGAKQVFCQEAHIEEAGLSVSCGKGHVILHDIY